MRIFLTGATGFIGSRILGELLAAHHDVIGLTRSETGAKALANAGAAAHLGTLEDPAALAKGAENADAVIHTAFDRSRIGSQGFGSAAAHHLGRRHRRSGQWRTRARGRL